MKIAAGLALLLGFAAVATANCNDSNVRVLEEQQGDVIRLLGQSDGLLDYTITLRISLDNMEASGPLPATVVVKDHQTAELIVLRVKDAQRPHGYHLDPRWRYGAPGGAPDHAAYLLPYLPGEKHQLTQGYFGKFSHSAGTQNEYAYDWSMPVGTTVCAAREGVVVGVRQDSDTGGPSPAYGNCGNYVVIRHHDGTYAEYLHLQKDGVLVALGAAVEAGQPIGLSGATGFVSVPHLHFAVFRTLDGLRRETLPVAIKTRAGLGQRLTEGQVY